ncbi:hypothetical protein C8Q76DRAFT_797464 [Earliella scabrosa]|nr:hypothetical protein C8Q76DRAFT_797464 [Earliella scabrosa]
MKSFFALCALVASTFAQNVAIGAPADMTTITPGSDLTVRVDRPNSLTGSEEVVVVIGLWPCQGSCADQNVTEILGNVVYKGAFDPQYDTNEPAGVPPHQNFTVTVPESFTSGQVSLGVVHVALVGASMSPLYEFKNVTLLVE